MKSLKCLFAVVLMCAMTGCTTYQQAIDDLLQQVVTDRNPKQAEATGSLLPPIGTMFCKDISADSTAVPDDRCVLEDPATWFAPNLSDADKQAVMRDVFQERVLKDLTAKRTIANKVDFDASIPGIGALVSANGGLNFTKDATVTISGDALVQKSIKWLELMQDAPKLSPQVRNLFTTRNYLIVAVAYSIKNYKATVEFSQNLNVNAKASLDAAVANLGKGASAGFTINPTSNGNLQVSAAEAVFRVVFAAQPATVSQAAPSVIKVPDIVGEKVFLPAVETLMRAKLLRPSL